MNRRLDYKFSVHAENASKVILISGWMNNMHAKEYYQRRNQIQKCSSCPFIQILSWFYPDFILILFRFYHNFIQTLFRFYCDFSQIFFKLTIFILSRWNLDKIRIKSAYDLDKRTWTGLKGWYLLQKISVKTMYVLLYIQLWSTSLVFSPIRF